MCPRFQFCTHQRVCVLHFLKKSQIRCTLLYRHLQLYKHLNCTGTPTLLATQLYCHLNCNCHLNCTGNSTVLNLCLNYTGISTVIAHELYWHSGVLPPQLQWRLNFIGTSTVTVPLLNFENKRISKFWLS
jgi:hypothetical protein